MLKLGLIPLALLFECRRGLLFTRYGKLSSLPPGIPANAILRPRRRTRASRHFGQIPGYRVSVIIPAYNEEVVLRACVESIVRSKRNLAEVVIVDDGGSAEGLVDTSTA